MEIREDILSSLFDNMKSKLIKSKQILANSFNDSFYVCKTDKESNYTYLSAIIDKIYEMNPMYFEDTDYERIANIICIIDNEIKQLFTSHWAETIICICGLLNFEIVFDEIDSIDISNKDFALIQDFVRYEPNCSMVIYYYKTFWLFNNYNKLTLKQQELLIREVSNALVEKGFDIHSFQFYVENCSDENVENIAFNSLLKWVADKKNKRFNYQTSSAVEILSKLEKSDMYKQMYSDLYDEIRKNKVESCLREKTIIENIIAVDPINSIPFVQKMDYQMSEDANTLLYKFINLRKQVSDVIIDYLHNDNLLRSKVSKLEKTIKEDEGTIEKQAKIINEINHKLIMNEKEFTKIDRQKKNETEALINELYALREFIFSQEVDDSLDNNDYENNKELSVSSYRNVAIVGGHTRWQKKAESEMPEITILNIDQNIIDFSFLEKISLVVIITNHINHSIYYRVMSKLKNQELLYVKVRNINQLKHCIDVKLQEIGE